MAPPQPAAPAITVELALKPTQVGALLRHPAVVRRPESRLRSAACVITWHDTPARTLARRNRSLGLERGAWRLERLVADAADTSVDDPDSPPPDGLVPVAAFRGRRRLLSLADGLTLELLDGSLRGVADERPACRLRLSGAAAAVATLALQLAATLPLAPSPLSLAGEALALADGAPPPSPQGGPAVRPGQNVEAALRLVLAHLAAVISGWAPLAPLGASDEPVHQMRVAVRRLRSALGVFDRAAGGPTFDRLQSELRALAAALGEARDWDVFLIGAGAAVSHAFPGDPRIKTLLAAAATRRRTAYATLAAALDDPDCRRLLVELALLPDLAPWQDAADPDRQALLAEPVRRYATHTLSRRRRKMAAVGDSLDGLSPDALHDIRKQGKRLRYAAEFFAPLYAGKPVRRFLNRLAQLQEELGLLNDGHTAGHLMVQLGHERSFAAGAVQGLLAAHAEDAAQNVGKAWERFLKAEKFWE